MTRQESLKQAEHILSCGKKIHDVIMRTYSQRLAMHNRNGAGEELSVSQLYTLQATRAAGEVTISRLADLLEVSPPSASSMVDRLVEKGFLTRTRSTEDRRKVVVRLASDAEAHIRSIEESILEAFADIVDKLGPETAEKWCDVLSRVRQVLLESFIIKR